MIGDVAVVPREVLASYHDYAGAQRAVDFLSDEKFPVEHTAIVGSELKLVEQVTGRLTTARAGLAGLASGAYFGLFVGLLFGIFTTGSVAGWFAVVAIAVAIGCFWGGLFGLVAHSLTGGRRDFSSRSTLTAQRYDLLVATEFAEQARQVLVRLT
jgi:hypothetical protein